MCFALWWVKNSVSSHFHQFSLKNGFLHQIHSWNTNLFRKLCLAPLWVESRVLPNLHHFFSNNAFYIKSTREIQLFLKNCILRYGELKTAFRRNSRWNVGFASNPLMEYNSFLKTVCCFIVSWKQRFSKFLPFLAENAFSIKSTHGLKLFF